MQLKDPTEWLEDLTVFMDDDAIIGTAQELEKTHVYEGPVAERGRVAHLVAEGIRADG